MPHVVTSLDDDSGVCAALFLALTCIHILNICSFNFRLTI